MVGARAAQVPDGGASIAKDYDPHACPRCGKALSKGCNHMVQVRALPRAGLKEPGR